LEFDQYTDHTRIKFFDRILTSNPINKISNVWSGYTSIKGLFFLFAEKEAMQGIFRGLPLGPSSGQPLKIVEKIGGQD
jgi:hypothetical protein